MALALPNSIFLHAAKTGGSWVRSAVTNAGIPTTEVGDFHAASIPNPGNKLIFSFVRNPLDWYISYWRCPHHRQRIIDGKNVFLHDANTPEEEQDFGKWLSRVLADTRTRRRRGQHLFSDYVDAASFVGKRENLVGDLVSALRLAGQVFDERAVRSTKPKNVSSYERPRYTRSLIEEVVEMEQIPMERFGYSVDPADYLAGS